MKNRIYYFIGTGNSLRVAQTIADALGDTELVAIQKGTAPVIPSGLERVGFVYPTYYWGMPGMVAHFIKNAQFSDAPYLFLAPTYGGLLGTSVTGPGIC